MAATVGTWERNGVGLFDCPEHGCDVKGRNGKDTPQGIAAHVRSSHPHLWQQMRDARDEATEAAEAGDVMEGQEVPAAEKAMTRAGQPLLPGAVGQLAAEAQQPHATSAAVAILNLPEIAPMSSETLRQVLEAVCLLKALDEPRPAPEPQAERANGRKIGRPPTRRQLAHTVH